MDLEKQIIAEILLANNYEDQLEFYFELSVKDFEDVWYKEIFTALSKLLLRKEAIDLVSAHGELSKLKNFDAVTYSKLIENITYTKKETLFHIKLLKEKTFKREIQEKLTNSLTSIERVTNADDVEEQKDKLIAELSGFDLDTGSKFIDPQVEIEQIDKNLSREQVTEGYSWGINDLDVYTSGIMSPRMIVVGGLKKTGKSRFIINSIINLHNQDVPSIFLSLEMPSYEIIKLLISRYTNIPDICFRSKSHMNEDDRVRYENAKTVIDWSKIQVECNSGLSLPQIMGRIRKYSRLYPSGVIFIDFLQRIKHNRMKQAQELEEICYSIADATRLYNIPVVLLSQLSNIAEREGVGIGSLKGSGGIGESADTILLLDNLYRRNKSEENKGKMDIYIEQRYGDSGRVSINTDLGTCQFVDASPF